jgi:hypothetical protein
VRWDCRSEFAVGSRTRAAFGVENEGLNGPFVGVLLKNVSQRFSSEHAPFVKTSTDVFRRALWRGLGSDPKWFPRILSVGRVSTVFERLRFSRYFSQTKTSHTRDYVPADVNVKRNKSMEYGTRKICTMDRRRVWSSSSRLQVCVWCFFFFL